MKKADAMGSHLYSISKIPILSKEETLQNAYVVRVWMELESVRDALKNKLEIDVSDEELAHNQGLSLEELENIISNGKKSKAAIFKGNLRLVVAVAKKFSNNSNKLELNDLVQAGYLGLNRAIEKFDPHLGYQFSTYAHWWIRQAVCKLLSEQSHSLRVPSYIQSNKSKLIRISSRLKSRLGRSPTYEELALEANIPEAKVIDAFRYTQPIISLDYLIGKNKDTSYFNIIADEDHCPEYTLSQSIAKKALLELVETLDPIKARIITLRFNLGNNKTKPTSYIEIGRILGIKEFAKLKALTKEAEQELQIKCGIVDDEFHFYFLAFLDVFFSNYSRLLYYMMCDLFNKRSQLEESYHNWSGVLETLTK